MPHIPESDKAEDNNGNTTGYGIIYTNKFNTKLDGLFVSALLVLIVTNWS